ncbi:hypothetical protein JCM11641_002600 [Rhodosporidiobolus odoratus]
MAFATSDSQSDFRNEVGEDSNRVIASDEKQQDTGMHNMKGIETESGKWQATEGRLTAEGSRTEKGEDWDAPSGSKARENSSHPAHSSSKDSLHPRAVSETRLQISLCPLSSPSLFSSAAPSPSPTTSASSSAARITSWVQAGTRDSPPRELTGNTPPRRRAHSTPSASPALQVPAGDVRSPSPACLGLASPTPSSYCTAPPSPIVSAVPQLEPERQSVPPPDRFALLPREIQLSILQALVVVCEEDWRRQVRDGMWKGKIARGRWADGRAGGRRELVKMGRVSRLWRSLSLDGQLWSTAPAASQLGPDSVSREALLALTRQAGPFVRTLDAHGAGATLDWQTLSQMVHAMSGSGAAKTTNLRTIDLTSVLAFFLSLRSRALTRCSTGLHLAHLRRSVFPHRQLTSASSNHATGTSGNNILPYEHAWEPLPTSSDPRRLPLFESTRGKSSPPTVPSQTPVSRYGPTTTGSRRASPGSNAVAASSRLSSPQSPARPRPSQLGPSLPPTPPFPPPLHPPSAASSPATEQSHRVSSALRHLNLSACTSLTSGLASLAGALPSLEILELSRIGSSLRTEGLCKLLSSTPKLRKVDLEDASEVHDDVLFTLADRCPSLTHLIVSNCTAFTDVEFAAVAHRCTKLRVLEADWTAITDSTAKAFVELTKQRAALAQEETHASEGHRNPLVAAEHPAILSILDNRLTSRRISRTVSPEDVRPRTGRRGYWTVVVGFYHDEVDEVPVPDATASVQGSNLEECDERRVVVRSFYSSLTVDAANASRRAKEEQGSPVGAKRSGRAAFFRTRAFSDSEVVRSGGLGRAGCVVS